MGRWVRLMQLEILKACMRDELSSALCMLPLMYTDLRLPIDGMVLVSDASEAGGAFCRSAGALSRRPPLNGPLGPWRPGLWGR